MSDNIVSNDQALHDDIRKVNTQIRGDNLKIVYSYDEVTEESCYILINRCNTQSSCWSNLSVGKTRYSRAEVSYLRYLAELILQKAEKKLTSSNSEIDVALIKKTLENPSSTMSKLTKYHWLKFVVEDEGGALSISPKFIGQMP